MSARDSSLVRIYAFSGLASVAVLVLAGIWGGIDALLTVLVLAGLEITFSFDNAIVNAKILQHMLDIWQKVFLTLGIAIAVFGARLVLPIVLIAATAGLSATDVVRLAIERPDQYASYLTRAHPMIASFGGIFLLMIFMEFLTDYGRRVHWLRVIERPLMRVGRLRQVPPLVALAVLAFTTWLLAGDTRFEVLLAGVIGLVTYVAIRGLAEVFEQKEERELKSSKSALLKAGLVNFVYLELLDASFSLDSVIGAFAITNMVLLIAAGLGLGAVWVRSMTVHIVRRNTLNTYRYLDHGAHYAIGALAIMMLLSIRFEVHEAVTGSIGLVIIGLAFFSSWRYNQSHA